MQENNETEYEQAKRLILEKSTQLLWIVHEIWDMGNFQWDSEDGEDNPERHAEKLTDDIEKLIEKI